MGGSELERHGRVLEDPRASLEAEDEAASPVEPNRAIGRLTRQDAMQAQQMALELKRCNSECAGGRRV